MAEQWAPEDDDDYAAAKAELKSRFASWVQERGVDLDPEAPEALLHYKWG